ncbi:MAG: FAD:protein FMN transferase [Candidatus Magnetoovum sp. WYHC-5]|nr:FAD:protein FMN transferase [Candidatus Magnetoovum sp. WYHC-5]
MSDILKYIVFMPKRYVVLALSIVITALMVFVGWMSAAGKGDIYRKSTFVMDTVATITVVADSEGQAEGVIDASFKALGEMEQMFSMFKVDSEIGVLNENAGGNSVRVSRDTLELLKESVEIGRLTGGAFDVTVGPITRLWDFTEKKKKPSKEKMAEYLPLVDYRNIVLDEVAGTVLLKKMGMVVDLGGVAKGYAADKVVEILKKQGIKAGVVAIAGDIKVFGFKDINQPWKIGIRAPRGESDEIIGVLNLVDQAVSTSGDYERFFIENGERFHHLINPATGYPVNDFQSVTIVNEKGINTDALSTAVFVMGKKRGLQFIKDVGLRAFIVFNDGNTYITDNLKQYFEPKRNN